MLPYKLAAVNLFRSNGHEAVDFFHHEKKGKKKETKPSSYVTSIVLYVGNWVYCFEKKQGWHIDGILRIIDMAIFFFVISDISVLAIFAIISQYTLSTDTDMPTLNRNLKVDYVKPGQCHNWHLANIYLPK